MYEIINLSAIKSIVEACTEGVPVHIQRWLNGKSFWKYMISPEFLRPASLDEKKAFIAANPKAKKGSRDKKFFVFDRDLFAMHSFNIREIIDYLSHYYNTLSVHKRDMDFARINVRDAHKKSVSWHRSMMKKNVKKTEEGERRWVQLKTKAEFHEEGIYRMEHCVYSYEVQEGQEIWSLRDDKNSYVTIHIQDRKVLQARGRRNAYPHTYVDEIQALLHSQDGLNTKCPDLSVIGLGDAIEKRTEDGFDIWKIDNQEYVMFGTHRIARLGDTPMVMAVTYEQHLFAVEALNKLCKNWKPNESMDILDGATGIVLMSRNQDGEWESNLERRCINDALGELTYYVTGSTKQYIILTRQNENISDSILSSPVDKKYENILASIRSPECVSRVQRFLAAGVINTCLIKPDTADGIELYKTSSYNKYYAPTEILPAGDDYLWYVHTEGSYVYASLVGENFDFDKNNVLATVYIFDDAVTYLHLKSHRYTDLVLSYVGDRQPGSLYKPCYLSKQNIGDKPKIHYLVYKDKWYWHPIDVPLTGVSKKWASENWATLHTFWKEKIEIPFEDVMLAKILSSKDVWHQTEIYTVLERIPDYIKDCIGNYPAIQTGIYKTLSNLLSGRKYTLYFPEKQKKLIEDSFLLLKNEHKTKILKRVINKFLYLSLKDIDRLFVPEDNENVFLFHNNRFSSMIDKYPDVYKKVTERVAEYKAEREREFHSFFRR